VDLGGTPLLGVLLKQGAAAGGVDVHPVGDVAADGVEEALGVALLGEVANLLRTAGVLAPPGRLSMLAIPTSLRLNPSGRPVSVLRKS
jgi:hypothetical protein